MNPLPVIRLYQRATRRNNYANDNRLVIVIGRTALHWVVVDASEDDNVHRLTVDLLDVDEWTDTDPEQEWANLS